MGSFVMPGLRVHRLERCIMYAEDAGVAETTDGAVATRKKLEEFEVGDEVEAVVKAKTRVGTFCDINAETDFLVRGPLSLKKLLNLNEKIQATIQSIDLNKREGSIEIPDFKKLVKGRRQSTKPKKELQVDISGLDLANVDVDYEKGIIHISVKPTTAGSEVE